MNKLQACAMLVAGWCGLVMNGSYASPGAMGFLSTPTTVITGNPSSWMNVGLDWDNATTAVDGSGNVYAIPNTTLFYTVETCTMNASFSFKLTIPDGTAPILQPGGAQEPYLGDKVIIQIDPNYTGHTSPSSELEHGPNARDKDYRFEITLRHTSPPIFTAGYRTPILKQIGPNQIWDWGTLTALNFATATWNNGQYSIDIKIPKNIMGYTSGDIGLALAIINDLGHSHGNPQIWEVTSSHFPSSMVLVQGDFPSQPALVENMQSSEAWIDPRQWGTGYVSANTIPTDITFSSYPSYCWSEAIRLSECSIDKWDNAPASGVGTDQLNLAGWYQYHSTTPCYMRIWLRASKSGPGVIMCRFLTIWGRPNIGGAQEWYVARLTEPIPYDSTNAPINFLWQHVPSDNYTSHPCFRAYVLPMSLDAAPYDSASIASLTTQATLSNIETHYGVVPTNSYSAQMNFTALRTGSCPNADKCAFFINKSSFPSFSLVGNCYAQTNENNPGITHGQQVGDDGKKAGFIRIIAEGFGIADPEKPPYTYIQRLGGIAWVIPEADLPAGKDINLAFDLSNPPLAGANMAKKPYVAIKSPKRKVFLSVKVEGSPGVTLPEIKIDKKVVTLEPGQSVSTTIVAGVPINWWPLILKILILLIILILIIFFIIKKLKQHP